MKQQALAIPLFVAALVRTQLQSMRLLPNDVTDDMILCRLDYEHGSASIIVMYTTEQRWFRRTKPVVSLSLVEQDSQTRAVKVHFNETTPIPSGPNDLQFSLRLAVKIRAMAWALAATTNMGECVSLPGRPHI